MSRRAGAPGVSAALLAGWRAFGVARYHEAAERALQCTWRRGLLFKGLMACHGISGNTWMLLFAAQLTGDARYTYQALAFQQTALAPAVNRQPKTADACTQCAIPPKDAPSASDVVAALT